MTRATGNDPLLRLSVCLSLIFFVLCSCASLTYATSCFGFDNSTSLPCVQGLGVCAQPDLCVFATPTYIHAMGRNDKSQLGVPNMVINQTTYPFSVDYGSTGRIFYISKMASDYSLITDYNGMPMTSQQGSGFTNYILPSEMTIRKDYPIAVVGDNDVTALITTNNNVYFTGLNYRGSLPLENPIDNYVYTNLTMVNNNFTDISIGKYGGCAIVGTASSGYSLYTFGLINAVLLNVSQSSDSSLLTQTLVVNSTKNSTTDVFDVSKCEVFESSYSSKTGVNLFLLKDNGDLMVLGSQSLIDGLDKSITANFDYCNTFDSNCIKGAKTILTNVDSFKCSATHCVASRNSGSELWTWGQNNYGQLCNGGFTSSNTPYKVFGGASIIQVTATKNNIYVLNAEGNVWGCGSNSYGQMGVPSTVATTFKTYTRVYVPLQYRKIWQLADGPQSEHLLMFSGLKCSSLYSGPFCNVPNFQCGGIFANQSNVCSGMGTCIAQNVCICFENRTGANCENIPTVTCNGTLANSTSVCSGRGNCTAQDTCSCGLFQGTVCESLPADFNISMKTIYVPDLTEDFNTPYSVSPDLQANFPQYASILSYIKNWKTTFVLKRFGSVVLTYEGTTLDLTSALQKNLQVGFYELQATISFNLLGYAVTSLTTSTTFENRARSVSVVSFDKSSPYFVSKNAKFSLGVVINDIFLTTPYYYSWTYQISGNANTVNVTGTVAVTSTSPLTLSIPVNAADFTTTLSSDQTNVTIIYTFKYLRYEGESSLLVNLNTISTTVIAVAQTYVPSITISRYPNTKLILTGQPATVSSVLTYADTIPDGLTVSYDWSVDPSLPSTIGLTNAFLYIPADTLTKGATYIFTLSVTVSYMGNSNVYTTTYVTVTAPALPSYMDNTGIIQLSPSTGVALTTLFNVSITPLLLTDTRTLSYSVLYKKQSETTYKRLLELPANQVSGTTYLPYGTLDLALLVTDEYGNTITDGSLSVATTQVDINTINNLVQSRNMSANDIEAIAFTLNSLDSQSDTSAIRELLAQLLLDRLGSSGTTTSQAIVTITSKSSDLNQKISEYILQAVLSIGSGLRGLYSTGGDVSGVSLSLVNGLSNIVGNQNLTSSSALSHNITSNLASLARQVASTLLPSQNVTIVTSNVNLVVFSSSSVSSTNYSLDNSAIQIPTDFDSYLGNNTKLNTALKLYGVELVYYKTPLFQGVNSTNGTRSSNVISFTISASGQVGGSDISEVSVKNLTSPLSFTFIVANSSDGASYDCRYIDETANVWSKEGCTSVIIDTTHVKCLCNHATKFSTFRLFTAAASTAEAQGNTGIRIVNVVFGIIYFILAATVFVSLIVLRKENPVRSRFIAPFVGLIAIMIDSLVISFIQSIVLLSLDKGTKNTAAETANIASISNGFNYFNVILVIPLYLTAFFTFLVQVIRYFFKRQMYQYMSNKTVYNAKLFKAITSKTLYWIFLIISLSVIMGYYAIWVGLSGGNVFSANSLTFTYITSLSYFGLAWILAIGIGIVAAWDLFYMNGFMLTACCGSLDESFKKSAANLTQVRDRVESIKRILARTTKQKAELGKTTIVAVPQVYYFTDDNLYFRLEMHLFLLAFVALTGNYLAGIADISVVSAGITDAASRLIPQIIGLIFGIIYTFLLIIAFGGAVVVCHLIEKRQKKPSEQEAAASKSVLEEDALVSLLDDRLGKPLLREFCQKEFSLENFDMYFVVLNLQRTVDTKSDKEVKDSISEICDTFVVGSNGGIEVNLSAPAKKAFMNIYNNASPTKDSVKEMLDVLLIDVIYNLKDTFGRFETTEEYKLYQKCKDNINILDNSFL